MAQRMFHGDINAAALADQLQAHFQEGHYLVSVRKSGGSALIQIGSKHGTPLSVNVVDTVGGVLVNMGQDRDWLDKASDAGAMIERAAAGKPLSILTMIPDLIAEMGKENLAPKVWDKINDICALSRALAGEKDAPLNPIICLFCQTPNPPGTESCEACGAALPVDLPRVCPKCGRGHTSDALFCQACGTRLIEG